MTQLDYVDNLRRVAAWQRAMRDGTNVAARMFSADRAAPPRVPRAVPFVSERRRRLAEDARAGVIERVHRGVYLRSFGTHGSAALDRDERILRTVRGVVESSEQDVVFSHSTAGLLHGGWLYAVSDVAHVTYLVNPHVEADPDARLIKHWTRLPTRDRAVVDEISVTSPERTVVDCARLLPFDAAVVLADSLFRLGADPMLVGKIMEESRGKRGVVKAREVLQAADPGSASPGETLVRLGARRVRTELPETQIPVTTRRGTYWIDVGWRALKIGFEFHGAVKYTGGVYGDAMDRRQDDAARAQALGEAGWIIADITWDDSREPERLEHLIRSALIARSRSR